MRMFSVLSLCMVVGLTAARADEKVENPAYKNWAQFPKGTAIVVKTVSELSGNRSESTMTTKIVEVTDDKITLEMVSTITVDGKEITTPGIKLEQQKMIELPAGMKKEEFGKQPPGSFEQGEETLKVGETEYKTKWFKSKTEVGETKTESQVWTSDKVPGNMIKSVMKLSGPVAGTTTVDLIEIKKP